jgi:hypothetical protein
VFRDAAFVSTSLSRKVAAQHMGQEEDENRLMLKINVPKGANALAVKNSSEREVILPRRSRFRVSEVKRKGDRITGMTWDLLPGVDKYSVDQARDELGRWTLTGGSTASPLTLAGPVVSQKPGDTVRRGTIDAVRRALDRVPEAHMDFLDKMPIRVLHTLENPGAMGVTRNAYAGWQDLHPTERDASGKPPPEELQQVTYNTLGIEIADAFNIPGIDDPIENEDVDGTVTHEIGHAIDNLLRINTTVGYIDRDDIEATNVTDMVGGSVREAFMKDMQSMNLAELQAADYYTTHPMEWFAEAYAAAFTNPKRAFGLPIERARKRFSRSIEAARKVVNARLYERFAG